MRFVHPNDVLLQPAKEYSRPDERPPLLLLLPLLLLCTSGHEVMEIQDKTLLHLKIDATIKH